MSLAAEIGFGGATLAAAQRIGQSYGSAVFSSCPQIIMFSCSLFWFACAEATSFGWESSQAIGFHQPCFQRFSFMASCPCAWGWENRHQTLAFDFAYCNGMLPSFLLTTTCKVTWWDVLFYLFCFMLLVSKVKTLVQCGHRDVLGQADNDLWTFYVQNLGVNKPDGEVIPISVYGDEVQVFDNKLYMCKNWMSEVTRFSTNSKASRFLVGLVPATMYVTEDKVNVTLQELLRCVVRDLNALRDGVEGLKGGDVNPWWLEIFGPITFPQILVLYKQNLFQMPCDKEHGVSLYWPFRGCTLAYKCQCWASMV